jgi:hypothetical protein
VYQSGLKCNILSLVKTNVAVIMKDANGNGKASGSKIPNKSSRKGEPVSMYPLSPEEAMRHLLRVPPELKENQREQARNPG